MKNQPQKRRPRAKAIPLKVSISAPLMMGLHALMFIIVLFVLITR